MTSAASPHRCTSSNAASPKSRCTAAPELPESGRVRPVESGLRLRRRVETRSGGALRDEARLPGAEQSALRPRAQPDRRTADVSSPRHGRARADAADATGAPSSPDAGGPLGRHGRPMTHSAGPAAADDHPRRQRAARQPRPPRSRRCTTTTSVLRATDRPREARQHECRRAEGPVADTVAPQFRPRSLRAASARRAADPRRPAQAIRPPRRRIAGRHEDRFRLDRDGQSIAPPPASRPTGAARGSLRASGRRRAAASGPGQPLRQTQEPASIRIVGRQRSERQRARTATR